MIDNSLLIDPVISYVEKHHESYFEWEMKVKSLIMELFNEYLNVITKLV